MEERYTFLPKQPGGLIGHLLNHHPLDLVERHGIVPAVVELRSARAGVVGHGSRLLQGAAVL